MSLKEEFASLKGEALNIVEKAKTDGMTAELKADLEKRYNRMTEIENILAAEKKISALNLEADAEALNEIKDAATKAFKQEKPNMENTKKTEISVIDAVNHFARTGSMEKYSTVGLTSGTNSGVLMPKSIPSVSVVRLTPNAFRRGFQTLGVATYTSGVTDNMSVPTLTDASNTANNDKEGDNAEATADATTGEIALNLVEYHSKALWFSKKVVNAQDFDLTSFAYPAALSRIDRKEDADWAATVIADTTIVGKTTASTTAVTLNELIDWDESFTAGYDSMPKFVLVSKALRTALRKLEDDIKDKYFSIVNNIEYLFGKPLIVCGNLEAMTAGKVIGAMVGVDGFDGSIIRDTNLNEIVRYENIPSHTGSIGFEALGWSAFGYNPNSIKTLKTAAS